MSFMIQDVRLVQLCDDANENHLQDKLEKRKYHLITSNPYDMIYD